MIPSLMILDGGSRGVMVDINQGVCSDSVMNIWYWIVNELQWYCGLDYIVYQEWKELDEIDFCFIKFVCIYQPSTINVRYCTLPSSYIPYHHHSYIDIPSIHQSQQEKEPHSTNPWTHGLRPPINGSTSGIISSIPSSYWFLILYPSSSSEPMRMRMTGEVQAIAGNRLFFTKASSAPISSI